MANESTSGEGISLMTALGIAAIVLKLCNVIAWSWWWVLCPFWIGIALGLLFTGLVMIGCYVASLGSGRRP